MAVGRARGAVPLAGGKPSALGGSSSASQGCEWRCLPLQVGDGKHSKCSSVGTKKNTSLPLLSPPQVPDPHQGARQALLPRCLRPLALAGKQAERREGVGMSGEVWAHVAARVGCACR